MTHLSMTESAADYHDHWGDHVTDEEYAGGKS
jgi:hypothetical protein